MEIVTLSDGTEVELVMSQRAVWAIQESMLNMRADLVDNAGMAVEDLGSVDGVKNLDTKATASLMRSGRELTEVYVLRCVRKWSRPEPFDEDAMLDLETADFNLIATKAMDMYKAVNAASPLDSLNGNSKSSPTSSRAATRQSIKRSTPK